MNDENSSKNLIRRFYIFGLCLAMIGGISLLFRGPEGSVIQARENVYTIQATGRITPLPHSPLLRQLGCAAMLAGFWIQFLALILEKRSHKSRRKVVFQTPDILNRVGAAPEPPAISRHKE